MRRVEYTEGEEVPLRQRDLERKLRVDLGFPPWIVPFLTWSVYPVIVESVS